jgi:hypothetical protein
MEDSNHIPGPTMPQYKRRPPLFDAIQLNWANWNALCALAGVGELLYGKPQGCYIDGLGNPTQDFTDNIGLAVPRSGGVLILEEGDWVVRDEHGELMYMNNEEFQKQFEEA